MSYFEFNFFLYIKTIEKITWLLFNSGPTDSRCHNDMHNTVDYSGSVSFIPKYISREGKCAMKI